jgi:hypothetical protein
MAEKLSASTLSRAASTTLGGRSRLGHPPTVVDSAAMFDDDPTMQFRLDQLMAHCAELGKRLGEARQGCDDEAFDQAANEISVFLARLAARALFFEAATIQLVGDDQAKLEVIVRMIETNPLPGD